MTKCVASPISTSRLSGPLATGCPRFIPIAFSSKYELVINLKTARALGQGELLPAFRSFGFEFQGPCSAFTPWRARERDPKTFSLAAHNQELVLGHVTFVL